MIVASLRESPVTEGSQFAIFHGPHFSLYSICTSPTNLCRLEIIGWTPKVVEAGCDIFLLFLILLDRKQGFFFKVQLLACFVIHYRLLLLFWCTCRMTPRSQVHGAVQYR